MKGRLALISNSPPNTGTGKYALKLWEVLQTKNKNFDFIYIDRQEYALKKFINIKKAVDIAYTRRIPIFDNKTFLYYRLGKKIPKYDLYHIVTQNLSFLRLYPRIITVLDIVHLVFPETKMHYLVGKYVLYRGIQNSKDSTFIAISNHTKKDIIRYLGVASEKIRVIYLGVDRNIYKPLEEEKIAQIFEKYKLSKKNYLLLYVGSDHPRKNLLTLIKAIYKIKKRYGLESIKLVKVGAEKHVNYRKRMINLINKLNLRNNIIFIDNVPEEDLPAFYNAADLFVYPSLYEGFGLPPLEAMACGTPVITSNTSSLPEVVGNAGIIVDPYDVDGLAKAMYKVLTNKELKEELRKRGLERAQMFSWKKTAEETLKVYEEL